MYAYIYMYVFYLAKTVCLVPVLKLIATFAVVILNCFNYLFRCYHLVLIHEYIQQLYYYYCSLIYYVVSSQQNI